MLMCFMCNSYLGADLEFELTFPSQKANPSDEDDSSKDGDADEDATRGESRNTLREAQWMQ